MNIRNFKKAAALMALSAVLCLTAACGQSPQSQTSYEAGDEIRVCISNQTDHEIAGLSATWCIGHDAISTTAMESADGGDIGDGQIEFVVTREDLPSEVDMEKFAVKFGVKELNGVAFDVSTLSFPAEFGQKYSFQLVEEDGSYSVWQVLE